MRFEVRSKVEIGDYDEKERLYYVFDTMLQDRVSYLLDTAQAALEIAETKEIEWQRKLRG